MGSWGNGIFQNDTTLDVHDALKERLAEGEDVADAIERVSADLDGMAEDEPELFAIAVAATLMKYGRLTPEARDRAIATIDTALPAPVEEDSPLPSKRALAKLREDLLGPQPAPKKIRRYPPTIAPFEPGTVIRIPTSDGRGVLAMVTGRDYQLKNAHQYIRLLRQDDGRPFDPIEFGDDLCRFEPNWNEVPEGHRYRNFMLCDSKLPKGVDVWVEDVPLKDPRSEVLRRSYQERIAQGSLPPLDPKDGWVTYGFVVSWKTLNGFLLQFLDGPSGASGD